MSANLRNCPECGRVFSYVGRNLCPNCLDKEEQEYQIVRKWVRDHPGAGIFEVSEGTGIEEEKIMQFLRDGRLKSKGFENVLECERCGKKITGGKYCENCLGLMDASFRKATPTPTKLQGTAAPPSRKKSDRMHIKSEE